ncbi:MAG: 50S ribosomal protein L3 [Candidatus Krumholzibacteriota bacterium]|nr:50S ribosomal protein L3 [Candidatus Krumholzibacteriota bacterium]
MSLRLLGKKLGMTQIFEDDGRLTPVTVIELGPNYVTLVKTLERDGYRALQLGFDPMSEKRASRPEQGHLKQAGLPPLRHLRECRVDEAEAGRYQPGDALGVDLFSEGDQVDVTGWSKGRGTAGVIKRHGMHGTLSMTHGSHETMRHAGSIGQSATPSRVFRGKRMAGRFGNDRRTVQNLRVVGLRPEENLLLVKGAVPGSRGGLVMVRKSIKNRS